MIADDRHTGDQHAGTDRPQLVPAECLEELERFWDRLLARLKEACEKRDAR